jgi:predicted dehydrogenase
VRNSFFNPASFGATFVAALMNPNTNHKKTRRQFIRTVTTASSLLAAGALANGRADIPKLRAAVIGHTGHGDYGHGLESIFAGQPGIELVALADPDPTGRASTAAKIKAPRQYADYRNLLAKEKPNLVSLAMRSANQHHAIALAALRAGAHIYCEKPLVTCPVEADELLAEAEKRGLKIAVAHTMRLSPPVVRLKQVIAEGTLGELMELRAYGKQDRRAGGEDMMVLGTHLFDLLRLFAGDPLWCTAHVLWQGRDITVSDAHTVEDDVGPVAGDQVFAQFAFARGINATFTSTERLRETVGHWGLELHGSKGIARIACDAVPKVFLRRTTGWKAENPTDTWQPLDPAFLKLPPAQNVAPVRDWLEAIAQNREPECSGRNAAWAVEMASAVYQAALDKKRVVFPLRERTHPLMRPSRP